MATIVVEYRGKDSLTPVNTNVKASLGSVEKLAQTGTLAWTEMASAVGLAKQGLALVKNALDSVINPTVELAAQTRDLGRNLGVSAEEASTLISVADDLKIPLSALEMGFKTALTKGVQPNIEGLKELQRKYQAIPDPVGRAQFAIEMFGRSGLEMQKILELSTDELDDMAESARKAGLVMDEEAVLAARNYEVALDDAGDAVLGLKVRLGTELLPVLTDTINRTFDNADAVDALRQAFGQGVITGEEFFTTTNKLKSGQLEAAEVIERVTAQVDAQTGGMNAAAAMTARLRDEHDNLTSEITITGEGIVALTDRHRGLAAFTNEQLIPAVSNAAFSLRSDFGEALHTLSIQSIPETVTQIDNYIRELGDATLTNFAFQSAVQEITQAFMGGEISRTQAMMQLRDLKGVAADGIVTLDELAGVLDGVRGAAGGAAGQAASLRDRISELHSRDITITTRYVNQGQPGPPRQHGGPVWPGGSFWVGEAGPELFVPSQGGQIIPNRSLTFNNTFQFAGAPASADGLGEAVSRRLGRMADARLRTF